MKQFNCIELRERMEQCIKNYVTACKDLGERIPCLTTITVGEECETIPLVQTKETACRNTGVIFRHISLNELTSHNWIVDKIKGCNDNELINGIHLQFPFKSHYMLNEEHLLNTIDPNKDVDSINALNRGRINHNDRPLFLPTVAQSVLDILLIQLGLDLEGKHITIYDKKEPRLMDLVQLLTLYYKCSVTVINSNTPIGKKRKLIDLADILIVNDKGVELLEIPKYKGLVLIDLGTNGYINRNELLDYEERFGEINLNINQINNSIDILSDINLVFNTCLSHLAKEVNFTNYPELFDKLLPFHLTV